MLNLNFIMQKCETEKMVFKETRDIIIQSCSTLRITKSHI